MKIFAKLLTASLAVTLIIGLSGFTSSGNINSAGIDKDFGCLFVDGGGTWYASYDHNLKVSNNGGNSLLICHFSDVPVPVNRVVKASGFPCHMGGGVWTTDSSYQLTPGGQGVIKCMIKK